MAMETWGATVHASPSSETEFGRRFRAENPDTAGSLGVAISEAVEDTMTHPGTRYALGSVLNHVCLHQTVIGQEALRQMELAGEYPDVVIGCAGGGSNFAGIAFPFARRNLKEGCKTRLLAVEPSSCPSLTRGEYRYDFGDVAMTTPLLKMYTLGNDFMPPALHAGGLRYHGMAPTVSHLHSLGLIESRAYGQTEVFDAAALFARTEGLIPAPESSHAIKAAIDEALEARTEGKPRVIVFNLSGHGLLDLTSYEAHLNGSLNL
jgi:tryptophan synthase beta chain